MARRFEFRLETVERLRRAAKEQQQRAVAAAAREVRRVEERIQRTSDELRAQVHETRSAGRARRIDVGVIRSHEFYNARLQRTILYAQADLAARQRELAAERNKLAEAMKRLKVIEKLRERQWQRFRQEQERQDQAETDEMALQMVRRNGPGGSGGDAA